MRTARSCLDRLALLSDKLIIVNRPKDFTFLTPMASRPNVLYIVHRIPYPPNRGDRIRSYHLLKFLAERANVWLACLADEPPEQDALGVLNQICRGVRVEMLGPQRWVQAAVSFARGRSATEALFYSRCLRHDIREWCRQVEFDSIVAFCSSTAPYLEIPELQSIPLITDLVDVDSQKFLDYARDSRGLKRLLFQMEGQRLQRLERRLGSRSDLITVVTQTEADIFSSFADPGPLQVVGNGIDLEHYDGTSEGDSAVREEIDCLFVGALDYRPNIDGIRWFCHEVWPLLVRERPEASLTIVGRRPAPVVTDLARLKGVTVHADVPDVRPYYKQARVAVAPLIIARGVQNKVLEAMALRTPVIASPQALDGINLNHGEHAICVDTPGDWVCSIINTLKCPRTRRRLSNSGREFVESNHCWPVCLTPIVPFLNPRGDMSEITP